MSVTGPAEPGLVLALLLSLACTQPTLVERPAKVEAVRCKGVDRALVSQQGDFASSNLLQPVPARCRSCLAALDLADERCEVLTRADLVEALAIPELGAAGHGKCHPTRPGRARPALGRGQPAEIDRAGREEKSLGGAAGWQFTATAQHQHQHSTTAHGITAPTAQVSASN